VEYSSNKLSKISGISTRTLRYYDEIGLLTPLRVASSGYRIYGQFELNTLQQILFYRELGFPLDEIKSLIQSPDYDREQAFQHHLAELTKKREQLDVLIQNVQKSILSIKGETTMTDNEKFEGFKQNLIAENEKKFGAEIRTMYSDSTIEKSNEKLKGMTQVQYDESERLRVAYENELKIALAIGDPACESAQNACDLHKQWLCVFYPEYSKEYHLGLAEMYVADERFKVHYDKIAPGCAEFFRDAIQFYCEA
jgi:DNA-binding transcriptional MerR regulator